jgi:hypothetical protein
MMSEFEGDTGQPAGEPGNADGTLPALPVIQRFGGIRPMAQKLGVPVSTVQGWKERGAIPANRREEVLAAAARHEIAMEPADLAGTVSPAIELPGTAVTEPRVESGQAADHEYLADEPASTAMEEVASPPLEMEAEATPPEGPRVEESAATAIPPAMPPAARSSLIPAILAAGLVALVISGSAPYWTRALHLVPPSAPVFETGLGERVATLDRRLAELEKRPSAPQPAAAAGDMPQRLETVENLTKQMRAELDRVTAAAPNAAAPANTANVPDLTQRLETVSGELASLKAQLDAVRRDSAQAVGPERLAVLSNRIEENAAELRAMQGDLSRLVELPKRVDELSNTIQAASGQAARTSFILAAGQLEAALDSGQPYASQLGAVRRLSMDDPELKTILDQLEEHADEGVPPMAELRVHFEDTALAVAQAAQSNVSGGWLDQAWARLRSLVTVRPIGGDVPGDSPEAHVARAEARLDEGDLASAVNEVQALDGAAAEAAAPWLSGAQARVAADTAIERLRERALAEVLPENATE